METKQRKYGGRPLRRARLNISLPEPLYDQIAGMAERQQRTLSDIANLLLESGLRAVALRRPLPRETASGPALAGAAR